MRSRKGGSGRGPITPFSCSYPCLGFPGVAKSLAPTSTLATPQALWTLPRGRAARALMSAPLLLVLAFPIGALTGGWVGG